MICCQPQDRRAMMGMVEGPVDDSLILDPIRRLCTLVDLARPYGISTNVPLPRFCRMLSDMYELAAVYTKEGSTEKAFVLYLRFVGIVVEELPKHRDFANFSLNDKDNFDRQTISAMNAAEVLKRRIKTMYEKQAQDLKAEIRAKDETKKEDHSFVRPIPVTPPVLDLNLKSYVVCQKQVGYSLLFQRIIVPNDLPERFFDSFKDADDANCSKFAVLYGKLLRNSIIVSHVLIIDGSEASFEQLDRCITEPDSGDPNEINELLLVGCVCGSLSDSSVEYFISRSLLTEIICIVGRQGDRQTYILHLSNLPERKVEEKGVSAETTATALEIEKAHPMNSNENNFHSACQTICCHTHITPTLSCTIVDLRNSSENSKKMHGSSFSTPFRQQSMTKQSMDSVTKT
uniref:USP8 dimerisation domain-containing protein n=1 Tax=Panagrolaimus sp. JU765 TaxID=591449 RepID=A0AC34Q5V9_9BILA